MNDSPPSGIFYAAPISIEGHLVGVGQWRLADLSPRWVEFCKQLLEQHGENFRTALPSPLHRLELSYTSAKGTALVTFTAAGQIASSAVYLRGENPSAEKEVLGMFVESFTRSCGERQLQVEQNHLQAAIGLKERPLHLVVAWASPAVNDDDYRLVTELGNHLAAAYLCA